jgi:hypothetical protein
MLCLCRSNRLHISFLVCGKSYAIEFEIFLPAGSLQEGLLEEN